MGTKMTAKGYSRNGSKITLSSSHFLEHRQTNIKNNVSYALGTAL
jgi:hypothetical protein